MPKGILLDADFNLLIVGKRMVLGDTTYQNQKILIISDKNEFKDAPMRGVGAKRYLEDHTPDALAREIRQEFTIDGMTVESIKISSEGAIEVEAFYKN